MSPLPRMILISGWAHDASALEKLRRCLEKNADVSFIATGDLWDADAKIPFQDSYAHNLAKMIEKRKSPVFISGWSLGGMIAMETAARRPDLVAGLVLIATTPKFCSGRDWPDGMPSGALRIMQRNFKRDPRRALADFLRDVARPLAEKEEIVALKIEKACAVNPLELSAGLQYLAEKDLRGEAVKIKAPALVLHGREDAVIPVTAGLSLRSLLSNSEMRVYDRCGHGLPWQNPESAAADIKKFLEKCQDRTYTP